MQMESGAAAPPHAGVTAGIGELVRVRGEQSPDHPYVESADRSRTLTFRQLLLSARGWAALLDDLGAAPGAIIGLAVADPVDFTSVFMGVLASGRRAAPFDPHGTDAELAAVGGRIDTSLVISDRPSPGPTDWLTMPAGAFVLDGSPPARLSGGGGLVLSTSGTTGVPKVIDLDEGRLLQTARAVVAHHELSPADRGFNPLPLFHVNAEVVGLLSALVAGATLVLDDRFHRRGFWAALARHRITWVNAVPAILARLSVLQDDETVPPGIRFARSASAPLPAAVLARFERATGIPVLETYGMTEAASQITANPLHGPRKEGSVGLPVGTEVRVVGELGVGETGVGEPGVGETGVGETGVGENGVVEPQCVGRVEIRGPSVISAYARPGYEDRFDADGWLATGDLGYFDEDGYLYLVGRVDDVINRSGEKIYPREVEEVILAEPGVATVAVVAWDHEVLGQVPVAYLVAEGVQGADERTRAAALVARLQECCAEKLSRPKRPYAYHVVDQLPQSATGKVRRRSVAEGLAIYTLLVQ
ncbi:MAG: AMP-binding protein [Acidimicrobiales bacterium]